MQDNDIPFLFGSTAVAVYFLWDGILTHWEGVLLCWMFLVFLAFSVFNDREPAYIDIDSEVEKTAKKLKQHLYHALP